MFLLAAKADGLSPATQRWYSSRLHALAEHFHCRDLTSITTNDMRAYVVALRERDQRYENAPQRPTKAGGLSVDTVHGHIRALRRFWAWITDEPQYDHLQIIDPMARIKLPKLPNPQPKGIDLDDLKRLLAATDDSPIGIRNRAILLFMIDTGCRAGGLLTLKVEDLNIHEGFAWVMEKNAIQRPVYFSRLTKDVLARWYLVRPDVQPVFCNLSAGYRHYGKPLTIAALHYILRTLREKSGVTGRSNPHSFRHAFARIVLDNGADLASLAQLMGHQDPRITIKFYARYTRKELAKKHGQFSPATNLE